MGLRLIAGAFGIAIVCSVLGHFLLDIQWSDVPWYIVLFGGMGVAMDLGIRWRARKREK